jgi:hypothetical protein
MPFIFWHGQVQDYEVWSQGRRFVNRFEAVLGFPTNLPATLLEQASQGASRCRAIISDENPSHRAVQNGDL